MILTQLLSLDVLFVQQRKFRCVSFNKVADNFVCSCLEVIIITIVVVEM